MKRDINYIYEYKITAILREIPVEQIVDVAQAVYDGGIRLLEITFNQSSDTGIADTVQSIRKVKEVFGEELLVGAGTVLTVEQVLAAKAAGASFILTPALDFDVLRAANQEGMITIPGAMTPSEILAAYQAGADIVKVFPVDTLGGAAYIKAVRAPLNHIPLMAVGGVGSENIKGMFDAGAIGVGVASGLVSRQDIEGKRYGLMKHKAVEMVRKAKGE